MNSKKFIIRETGYLALGEVICCAATIGVFALLEMLDYTVFLGAALGTLLAVGNFFLMAVASDAAADKVAQDQDVNAGKKAVKVSYSARMLIIGALLFLFAKSGHCHIIAMIVPLFAVFPIIFVIEFFRKAGGPKK